MACTMTFGNCSTSCVAGDVTRCKPSRRTPAAPRQPRRTRIRASAQGRGNEPAAKTADHYDLILSSGFLSFASHSGFLQAVQETGVEVGGVMGTSAGALAGSLYCAGYSPSEVAEELSRVPPVQLLNVCWQPWKGGILSLEKVVERLGQLLPPTFEDLPRRCAVGVVGRDRRYRIISSGPLPEAVAASAAIPFLFANVNVPGTGPCMDGGVVDRVGLRPWRLLQRADRANGPCTPALVHLISRSSPFSGDDDVRASGETRVTVVRSPKSGVNLFSLGNYQQQLRQAAARAQPAIEATLERAERRRRMAL